MHDFGLESPSFFLLGGAVGDNDDDVAFRSQSGGGAVEEHRAGTGGGLDDVGDQPLAVVEVEDVNLLAGQEIGGSHQIAIDGDAPLVVQVGARQSGAVNFRPQHEPLHADNSIKALGIGDWMK